MSKYTLLIYSKDKRSLRNFLLFIGHNFKNFKRLFKKKKLKETVSVLKSPHVNKTAQEQFKYTYFYTNLNLIDFETKKNLLLFKKIKTTLFPDLKIVIKGEFKTSSSFHLKKTSIYKQNSPILSQRNTNFLDNSFLFKEITYFLKVLDYTGNM